MCGFNSVILKLLEPLFLRVIETKRYTMKKNLTIAAVAALTVLGSSEAFASKAGPYAGLQFGYVNAQANSDGKVTANRSFSRANFNDSSFLTEVLLGYLMDFSAAQAGVEAAIGFDTQKQKKNIAATNANNVPSSAQLKLERKVASSISLIAGTKVIGMFLFAKAGLGFSSYKTTYSTGNVSPKKTETFVSFVPAVGAEYPIVASLAVRGEVSYEIFQGKKVKKLTDSVTSISSDFKHKNLRALALKGGVVYHV